VEGTRRFGHRAQVSLGIEGKGGLIGKDPRGSGFDDSGQLVVVAKSAVKIEVSGAGAGAEIAVYAGRHSGPWRRKNRHPGAPAVDVPGALNHAIAGAAGGGVTRGSAVRGGEPQLRINHAGGCGVDGGRGQGGMGGGG